MSNIPRITGVNRAGRIVYEVDGSPYSFIAGRFIKLYIPDKKSAKGYQTMYGRVTQTLLSDPTILEILRRRDVTIDFSLTPEEEEYAYLNCK